jgi:DNA-binding GntR family transcriptional regulator
MMALSIDANRDMVAAIRRGDRRRAEEVTRELVEDAWKLARRTFDA